MVSLNQVSQYHTGISISCRYGTYRAHIPSGTIRYCKSWSKLNYLITDGSHEGLVSLSKFSVGFLKSYNP
ncbi:hypothetical protein GW17_00028326 [Ensete ventricosum]|nr:hypothetical protein GW17_00028326 [Ensete ventricosum]